MRYLYVFLVVLITLAVLVFTVQNISPVTVTFVSSSITLPLAILVLAVYCLGMLTGGTALSVIRLWIRRAANSISSRE
jgi:uncharacterized integral membrane protein